MVRAISVIMGLALAGGAALAGDDTGTVEVAIGDDAFVPASLTVAKGTKVIWSNLDHEAHTVTADNGRFKSPVLENGETFTWTFETPGTFSYFCSVHPYMTGRVEVRP